MYIGILSRGGLKNPSLPMSSAVSQAFDLGRDLGDIKKFGSSCKEGGNEDSATLFGLFVHRLSQHTEALSARLMKVVCNCFSITKGNDLINELIVKQNVAEFKRPKRQENRILIFNILSISIVHYDY